MPASREPEYDVALSFAGEQRDYVRAVASELTKHAIRVFFDEDNEIALWGKNLAEELQRIYMTASNVVVMFVSEDYARKSWPTHERQSAIARAISERREYILPVRFDSATLPGLDPSLSYLPLENRPPATLAENIMAKLVQLGGRIEPTQPAFRVRDSVDDGQNVCRIMVHDEAGVPINAATVLLIAQNGTSIKGQTGTDGIAELPAEVRRAVAVFVAHPEHRGAFYRRHDNATSLEVTLPAGSGVQSVILADSPGYLPGFGPRLNPIGSSHDADGARGHGSIYVSNGSVDGQVQQPYRFSVGTPMMLEDSNGKQVRATCVGFVGRSTLWEYEYPSH
jgi:hypothetical protein